MNRLIKDIYKNVLPRKLLGRDCIYICNNYKINDYYSNTIYSHTLNNIILMQKAILDTEYTEYHIINEIVISNVPLIYKPVSIQVKLLTKHT